MQLLDDDDDTPASLNWFRISTAARSAYTINTCTNRVKNASALVSAAKIVSGMETRSNMGVRRREIRLAMRMREK